MKNKKKIVKKRLNNGKLKSVGRASQATKKDITNHKKGFGLVGRVV